MVSRTSDTVAPSTTADTARSARAVSGRRPWRQAARSARRRARAAPGGSEAGRPRAARAAKRSYGQAPSATNASSGCPSRPTATAGSTPSSVNADTVSLPSSPSPSAWPGLKRRVPRRRGSGPPCRADPRNAAARGCTPARSSSSKPRTEGPEDENEAGAILDRDCEVGRQPLDLGDLHRTGVAVRWSLPARGGTRAGPRASGARGCREIGRSRAPPSTRRCGREGSPGPRSPEPRQASAVATGRRGQGEEHEEPEGRARRRGRYRTQADTQRAVRRDELLLAASRRRAACPPGDGPRKATEHGPPHRRARPRLSTRAGAMCRADSSRHGRRAGLAARSRKQRHRGGIVTDPRGGGTRRRASGRRRTSPRTPAAARAGARSRSAASWPPRDRRAPSARARPPRRSRSEPAHAEVPVGAETRRSGFWPTSCGGDVEPVGEAAGGDRDRGGVAWQPCRASTRPSMRAAAPGLGDVERDA